MPTIDQFARRWIDHAKTVGPFVRGRAIFIQPRCHPGRAAQRNKDSPPVRRGVNAAWSFAHWKGPDDAVCGSINHGDIAGAFVAYEHEIGWRFSADHARECPSNKPCKSRALDSHFRSRSFSPEISSTTRTGHSRFLASPFPKGRG